MSEKFKAIIIDNQKEKFTREIKEIDKSQLKDGNVLVKIDYSSLNYKDALILNDGGKIVRKFPFVPGIDFSGEVEETTNENFKIGDKVILNGFGVGEKYWGGLAQKARVKGEWLVKLPEKLTDKQALAIGTAGYTAMLCVLALEKQGVTPDKGEILVTGASGGVGSVAISLLSKLGYEVCASSGREEFKDYINSLGAKKIINIIKLINICLQI